jgi:hypothetical protein
LSACRRILASDWYQRLFATRLSPQRQAVPEFETTALGSRVATSVGGVLTGQGADIIVIDDPLIRSARGHGYQPQSEGAHWEQPCCDIWRGDLCFAMAAVVGHECRYRHIPQNRLHTDTRAVALNHAPTKEVAPMRLIYCRLRPGNLGSRPIVIGLQA